MWQQLGFLGNRRFRCGAETATKPVAPHRVQPYFKLRGKRVVDFQDIIDKVQGKLQGWKAKLLSQAGRTTLISSVLQAMPLYTFSDFKVPKAVCNKLDAITRSFWWGHEIGN